MPTSIIFVNRASAKRWGGVRIDGAILPVGFTKNRCEWCETKKWQDASIIIVDDEHYKNIKVCCPNANSEVVLYLHRKNKEQWNNQKEWVQEMGWQLGELEKEFNHLPNDRIWEIAKKLLKVVLAKKS